MRTSLPDGALDFTSALYLGMNHPAGGLAGWPRLTTGRPAVLGTTRLHHRVRDGLAELTGAGAASLARSTLHLMWDLVGCWEPEATVLLVDRGAYPVSRWAAGCAGARGMEVHGFAHRDSTSLLKRLASANRAGKRPVVITDGWCPRCGKYPPLGNWIRALAPSGGLLVIDDTQALGLFGRLASPESPFGREGGGTPLHLGLPFRHTILVASLAKAFGAPLAVLAAEGEFVERFQERSATRMHSSPPSEADLAAADHALAVNRRCGDSLRRRLADLIRRFRRNLERLGLRPGPGFFPVQSLRTPGIVSPATLYARLARGGIRALLLREDPPHRMDLAFVLTARHRPEGIDRAFATIQGCLGRGALT